MNIIRFLTLTCLAVPSLYAQSGEEPSERMIRFSIYAENNAAAALSRGGDASAKIPRLRFSYFDGEKLVEVDEASDGFHGSYQGRVVDGRLRLYRPGLSSLEDADRDSLLAEIPVPGRWQQMLLYTYNTTGTERARFLPLSNRGDLQAGRSLGLNLTGRPIAVVLGEMRFLLEENAIDEFDLIGAGGSGRIDIKVAAEWQQNWRLALSTSKNLRTDKSYLFLFKANDQSNRISVRIIDLPDLE